LQETYYKRTMLRKEKINLRKAKILGMYAIDLIVRRLQIADFKQAIAIFSKTRFINRFAIS